MLNKENIFNKNEKPARGKLLLSEPFMLDANFKRSVVFLCAHDEEGSIGFVLNQKAKVTIPELFPEFDYLDMHLYYGGPVEPNTVHYLHKLGDIIPNSELIADGIFWSGSFEVLKILMAEKKVKPNDIRFFIGYSGWGAGQIEAELKENAWFVTDAQNSDVFTDKSDKLWNDILKDMGGAYKQISNYPEDPSLN